MLCGRFQVRATRPSWITSSRYRPPHASWIGERAKLSGFVFSTTEGKKAFSGFSKAKHALDKAIAASREREGREPMPPWTLHDLRRTARSLMSRAKVPTDHAERVIGHVIGGVRETYDRYEYLHEKRDALEKLAGLVDLILNPPADNVVAMPDRQAETG
jgi:integrase